MILNYFCLFTALLCLCGSETVQQKFPPLPQIFHFLLADSFPLLALVLHYERGILVEDGILTGCQRLKVV